MNSRKRFVLVTGATGSIGSKIAVQFARNNWNLLCHYRAEKSKARNLKQMLSDFKVSCEFLKADFSSKKELSGFIRELKRYNIASLINNAGSYVVRKHFTELGLSEISEAFMVNVFAPMLLTGEIFLRMKKERFGRIVNISSIAAKYGGSAYSLHYGCSKRALEGLTKTLAREGAEYNVLVNTLRPGVIESDFHRKFPKDLNKRLALIPLKKMGSADDIAGMAYYLGSDSNNYITNEIITVAGGE